MAPHQVEITDSSFETPISRHLNPRKPISSILRVRGTQIVDGDGEPVILKGVRFHPSKRENPKHSLLDSRQDLEDT